MEIIFLIGRILFGGYFIMFGVMHFMKTGMLTQMVASRGVPAAKLMTLLTGLLLVLSGLGIVLGVYIVWSVWLLVVFLVLAACMVHHFWTDHDPQEHMMQKMNFMRNIALAGALLMILAIAEPWVYSVV